MSLPKNKERNNNRKKALSFDSGDSSHNAHEIVQEEKVKEEECCDTSECSNTITDNEEEELESEYDTDIEVDIEHEEGFDPSGKTRYLRKCEELGIVPASNFLSSLTKTLCDLRHQFLGPKGTQAIATGLMQNNYVSKLLMRDNSIQPEGSVYVAKLLRENFNITDVDLGQNELGSVGAYSFARVLRENDALRVLHLGQNSLKDKDAVALAEALKNNSGLRYFDMSGNSFCEEAGLQFGPAIDANTSLKTLDLSWNHLRGRGAIAIAKGLANNYGLHTLLLAWNGFGDQGASAVANALKENNTLQELDLSNNRISMKGCLEFADALKVNTTLKILRIGRNPIGGRGAHALLTSIQNNAESAMENLDLEGIMIEQNTQTMLSSVLKVKPKFDISCEFGRSGGQLGRDLEDVYNRRHRTDECSADYIIRILKDYVKSKNLRLLDLFNQFDKDKSQSVSREELVRGFKSIRVPLSDKQLDSFIREMDTDGDGEIDYSEFTWINDAS